MIELDPERIAAAAGAEVVARGAESRPQRAVIDNRQVSGGELFVGLPGAQADGGSFAQAALEAGAWGALVGPGWGGRISAPGWVLESGDPLAGLQGLGREWRRELGARTVGITGSTGKTSVKDICAAILPARAHASRENFNTEIGLPLSILEAPAGTEVLILEMGMRGRGQIAELCAIAEPDVGAITNVGPAHLELLGSVEAVAETKAEVLTGLGAQGVGVIPALEPLLDPHLPAGLRLVRFGEGGDVAPVSAEVTPSGLRAEAAVAGEVIAFETPFTAPHQVTNLLCAVAIGVALGYEPAAMASRSGQIAFTGLRGELVGLRDAIRLVNDTYNANPISMKAALEHLDTLAGGGRRIAVLGGMAELGERSAELHAGVAALAGDLGIEVVIGVGELARAYGAEHWAESAQAAALVLERLLEPGDTVLVKGSRSIGLEALVERLEEAMPA